MPTANERISLLGATTARRPANTPGAQKSKKQIEDSSTKPGGSPSRRGNRHHRPNGECRKETTAIVDFVRNLTQKMALSRAVNFARGRASAQARSPTCLCRCCGDVVLVVERRGKQGESSDELARGREIDAKQAVKQAVRLGRREC